jgi:hypothetical protein
MDREHLILRLLLKVVSLERFLLVMAPQLLALGSTHQLIQLGLEDFGTEPSVVHSEFSLVVKAKSLAVLHALAVLEEHRKLGIVAEEIIWLCWWGRHHQVGFNYVRACEEADVPYWLL